MEIMRVLGEPRRLLATATFVVALLGALFGFAYSPQHRITPAVLIAGVVALLAAFAATVKGRRGWFYLALAWILAIVGYGALPEQVPFL